MHLRFLATRPGLGLAHRGEGGRHTTSGGGLPQIHKPHRGGLAERDVGGRSRGFREGHQGRAHGGSGGYLVGEHGGHLNLVSEFVPGLACLAWNFVASGHEEVFYRHRQNSNQFGLCNGGFGPAAATKTPVGVTFFLVLMHF